MPRFEVTVTKEGNTFVGRVAKFKSHDQREGDFYEPVAIALGFTEDDALRDAVKNAFDIE